MKIVFIYSAVQIHTINMIRSVIIQRRFVDGLYRLSTIAGRRQQPTIASSLLVQCRSQSTVENREAQFEDNFHKEIVQAYTYNPVEGYIRTSPFEPVAVPNVPLDQYVWQNLPQWSNYIAMVSLLHLIVRLVRHIHVVSASSNY